MKFLKKIKSTLASFLTIILLAPMVLSSCSGDAENIANDDGNTAEYKKIEVKYDYQIDEMKRDYKSLKLKVEKQMLSKNSLTDSIYITQQTLDDYARPLGFQNGDVTVDMFHTVLDDHSELINNGLNYVINNKPLDNFTKQKAIEMISSQAELNDSELYTVEFDNLPDIEKEQLIFINSLVEDYNAATNSNSNDGFWDGFTSGSIGALAFAGACAIATGGTGAPGCFIAGFFIGMFVFAVSDK